MLITLLHSVDWIYCSPLDQQSSGNSTIIQMSSSALLAECLSFRIRCGIDCSIIPPWNDVYPADSMYHISCFGHTVVVLDCERVICFSIKAFWFNLLQEGKCRAIRLFLRVEVRLDKNIVPLSYKVRKQNTDRAVDSSTSSLLLQGSEWDVAWNNSAPWWIHCSA